MIEAGDPVTASIASMKAFYHGHLRPRGIAQKRRIAERAFATPEILRMRSRDVARTIGKALLRWSPMAAKARLRSRQGHGQQSLRFSGSSPLRVCSIDANSGSRADEGELSCRRRSPP